jgi:hypothetical protein
MNDIEKAEKVLRELEEKRECIYNREKTLDKKRQALSYAAETGDKKARNELNAVNSESFNNANDIRSVEAALTVARANLAAAQAAEAKAGDAEKAKAIAALNAKLKDELANADDAFADAIGSVLSARALLMEMHALGVGSPTDSMFRINSVAVIKTALQNLPQPWISDFEFSRLAPSQKKSFKPLAEGWCNQITNQIAERLPTDKKDAA